MNNGVKFKDIQLFFKLSMSLDQSEIIQRITELENEHRELDEIIGVLINSGEVDELKIKRLKKRKLLIKDMLICFENMLIPDIDA